MTERTFTDTGRTAIHADGTSERIFETFVEDGPFAGATYEVLESEVPTDWQQTAADLLSGDREKIESHLPPYLRGDLA